MSNPAIFLDRDGTLVQPRHLPTRPEHLVLQPGAPAGLADLQAAGFRVVVITNQPGIAGGMLSEAALKTMNAYLRSQLAAHGVLLDRVYWCPHHPEGTVADFAIDCVCRKPRPGLILEAARDLDIDLTRSWLVGDRLDDIEAGNRAGCRTVYLDLHAEPPPARPDRIPHFVARSSHHAFAIARTIERLGPPVELTYQPERWCQPEVGALARALPGSTSRTSTGIV
jgi:D-glycero-D-manno-heptose 1,7-bisphosphate phosphatase